MGIQLHMSCWLLWQPVAVFIWLYCILLCSFYCMVTNKYLLCCAVPVLLAVVRSTVHMVQ